MWSSGTGVTEQLQSLGQVLAHCSSFVQGAHKKAITGKAGGVPRAVSRKVCRPRGHCTRPGCALLDNSILRVALGLVGGQLGSEGDIRNTVTA